MKEVIGAVLLISVFILVGSNINYLIHGPVAHYEEGIIVDLGACTVSDCVVHVEAAHGHHNGWISSVWKANRGDIVRRECWADGQCSKTWSLLERAK